ncbi:hypothetical protein LCGC14_0311230 [marine sediment metagenome]|uniref:Tyrosine specific protein phosphatases domain-containing protein n=1 Tax=marine sediment metagenome TaxID=412755 RepID=A0A0F9TMF2_9ZZZZ
MIQRKIMFDGHAPRWWNKRNRRLRRKYEKDGDISNDNSGKGGFVSKLTDKVTGFIGGGYHYRSCDHWRTVVKIGDSHILASGLMDRPKHPFVMPGPKPWPDKGLYLDDLWSRQLGGISSAGVKCPIDPWWPYVIVDWSDRAAIDDKWYTLIVNLIIKWMKSGDKVEIACQGGHGRTGTLVAGVLAKVEGLSANDAIEALRDRYCKQVVESHSQICQIYRFLGEKEPDKPPIVPATPYYIAFGYKPPPSKSYFPTGDTDRKERLTGGVNRKEGTSITKKHDQYYGSDDDDDECFCRHDRWNHWGGGDGVCKMCPAAGGQACNKFRLIDRLTNRPRLY